MNYRIILIGKLSEPFYRDGIAEYLKRLTPYGKFELITGVEQIRQPDASPGEREKTLEKEAKKLLLLIKANEISIGLDVKGRQLTSEGFALFLQTLNESGASRVNFIVGSADGLADSAKNKCDHLLSFSGMTFPHQMAVLILTEQIYRGFRILRGEPYHK